MKNVPYSRGQESSAQPCAPSPPPPRRPPPRRPQAGPRRRRGPAPRRRGRAAPRGLRRAARPRPKFKDSISNFSQIIFSKFHRSSPSRRYRSRFLQQITIFQHFAISARLSFLCTAPNQIPQRFSSKVFAIFKTCFNSIF